MKLKNGLECRRHSWETTGDDRRLIEILSPKQWIATLKYVHTDKGHYWRVLSCADLTKYDGINTKTTFKTLKEAHNEIYKILFCDRL